VAPGAGSARSTPTEGDVAGDEIVDVLAEEWAAIVELGEGLAPADWDRPSECPGWDVKDLVSHMIGTERSLLGDPEPPEPPEPAPPHVRNGVGAGNERWVAARRPRPGADVLAEFGDVTARRLAQLGSFPPERFEEAGPSPVGVVPYREFMAVRVMDCWVHEQDMRVALGRPGRVEGRPAEVALGRIASAMPFVVGKRAAAPEGSSVRFEVQGPGGRRLDVLVRDGRAGVADELDGTPTSTLTMSTDAFWRLGCGRIGAEIALAEGLAAVGGDDALGRAVLGSMAFMI
jgi:uncharacterized protein (TIGR03083 family)